MSTSSSTSAAAGPRATLPAALLASRALQTVVRFLLPYFCIDCPDFATTRAEIIVTLAAYGPRNRVELFAAAKLVACTMTGLSAMAEAEGADLSPAMRLRLRTCANNVNRHANQAQRTLDKRALDQHPLDQRPVDTHQGRDEPNPVDHDPAKAAAGDPAKAAAMDAAEDAVEDAEVIEQVRQTTLLIEACRQRLAEADPEAACRLYPAQSAPDEAPAWVREALAAACAAPPPSAAIPASSLIWPGTTVPASSAIRPAATVPATSTIRPAATVPASAAIHTAAVPASAAPRPSVAIPPVAIPPAAIPPAAIPPAAIPPAAIPPGAAPAA